MARKWVHEAALLRSGHLTTPFAVLGDLRVYAALDPTAPEAFGVRLLALLALLLATGFALCAAGRRRPRPAWAGPDTRGPAHVNRGRDLVTAQA